MNKKVGLDEEDIYLGESTGKSFNSQLNQENEFFNESDYVPHVLINVKRIERRKTGEEDWEIWQDKEVVLTLKGVRFTKKEKDFLRGVDGMKFLMNSYKEGHDSVVKIKKLLKKKKLK